MCKLVQWNSKQARAAAAVMVPAGTSEGVRTSQIRAQSRLEAKQQNRWMQRERERESLEEVEGAPSHVSLPSSKAPGERERERVKVQTESRADERDVCVHRRSPDLCGTQTEAAADQSWLVKRSSLAGLSPGGGRPLLPLTVDGIEKSSVPKPQRVPGRQEAGRKGHPGSRPVPQGWSAHQMGCCFRCVYRYTFSTSFSSTGSHPATADQSKGQPLPPGPRGVSGKTAPSGGGRGHSRYFCASGQATTFSRDPGFLQPFRTERTAGSRPHTPALTAC